MKKIDTNKKIIAPSTAYLYQTGYFADAEKSRTKMSKVHIVNAQTKKPICGSGVGGSFLWCSGGVYTAYVTCSKCLKYI